MYGFGGVGLSEVQISISELSVVGGGGGWWTRQTHFMVGPGRGPTKIEKNIETVSLCLVCIAGYLKQSFIS